MPPHRMPQFLLVYMQTHLSPFLSSSYEGKHPTTRNVLGTHRRTHAWNNLDRPRLNRHLYPRKKSTTLSEFGHQLCRWAHQSVNVAIPSRPSLH